MSHSLSPVAGNLRCELILIRHGETAWNTEGRIQGHLDIPLNDTGRAQAAALGKRLGGERFEAVYSSDLVRAWQTALPIIGNASRNISREPRLRERHLGVLQGLTGEEAVARQAQAWKVFKARQPEAPLEGGESLGAFAQRAVGFVRALADRHQGGRVVVVTHGGVLDALYRHVLGKALDAPRDFPIYNASVNVISRNGAGWSVDSWGDVSHLPPELSMDDS